MFPPIQIPDAELTWTFSRSGGPGGQNVNKVSSKALLRWNLLTTAAFGFEPKALLIARLGGRLTKEGDLLISSQRFRDQPRNQEDCKAKLLTLLSEALRPVKVRRPTKPTRGSQERRVQAKKRQARKKSGRRGVRGEE